MATNATGGVRSAEPEDYRTERSEGGYAAGPDRSTPEVATIAHKEDSTHSHVARELRQLRDERPTVGERLSDQHPDHIAEDL